MYVPRRLTFILASLALVSISCHAAPAGAIGFALEFDTASSHMILAADLDSGSLASLGVLATTRLASSPTTSCSADYRSFRSRNTMWPSVRKRALSFCGALERDALVSRMP